MAENSGGQESTAEDKNNKEREVSLVKSKKKRFSIDEGNMSGNLRYFYCLNCVTAICLNFAAPGKWPSFNLKFNQWIIFPGECCINRIDKLSEKIADLSGWLDDFRPARIDSDLVFNKYVSDVQISLDRTKENGQFSNEFSKCDIRDNSPGKEGRKKNVVFDFSNCIIFCLVVS